MVVRQEGSGGRQARRRARGPDFTEGPREVGDGQTGGRVWPGTPEIEIVEGSLLPANLGVSLGEVAHKVVAGGEVKEQSLAAQVSFVQLLKRSELGWLAGWWWCTDPGAKLLRD